MEKLLHDLSLVLQEGRALVAEYKSKLAKHDEKEVDLNAKIQAHEEKAKDLETRTAAVSHIENVTAAETRVVQLTETLSQERANFGAEKKTWEERTAVVNSEIKNKLEEIRQIESNLAIQEKHIKDQVRKEVDAFIALFKK